MQYKVKLRMTPRVANYANYAAETRANGQSFFLEIPQIGWETPQKTIDVWTAAGWVVEDLSPVDGYVSLSVPMGSGGAAVDTVQGGGTLLPLGSKAYVDVAKVALDSSNKLSNIPGSPDPVSLTTQGRDAGLALRPENLTLKKMANSPAGMIILLFLAFTLLRRL